MNPRRDAYALLMDAAYRKPRGPDGDGHSLLGNLETVPDELWDAVPADAVRTVRDIVFHVGSCKYMYNDYAFGPGSMKWDAPPAWPPDRRTMPRPEVLAWLDEGHAMLSRSLGALDDNELDTPRRTNWGELWPAHDIIRVMIEHDLYHAGEINHLRSLLQQNDHWAYVED